MPDRAATRAFVTRDVDPLLVGELIEKLDYLCANRNILKRMSDEAVKDFEAGGKFSIGERNRQLTAAYGRCLEKDAQGTGVRA